MAPRVLARLPIATYWTTNYDKLIEKALMRVGKEPNVISYQKDRLRPASIRSDPDADHPLILKLHGDVDMVDDIVITDEDYIDFIGRMNDKDPFNPIPMYVRERLTRWSTLFIGYSLMDYNLRLLLRTIWEGIDEANRPANYSVDKWPDSLIPEVLRDEVDFWFTPASLDLVLGNAEGETEKIARR